MQGHILNAPGNPVITSLRLPVDEDPAGWVWQNQQPLVVSRVQSETRWPEFVGRAREEFGISTLVLVPLTAGDNRLGAFGFSSVAPLDPSPDEIAFLERVASEFAVAVEAFLAKQAGSAGAGPLAHAVRYHQCTCVEAGPRRVILRHIRPALEGHPARLRDADVVQ